MSCHLTFWPLWALVSEPGFPDFLIARFRDFQLLGNILKRSGSESVHKSVTRKDVKSQVSATKDIREKMGDMELGTNLVTVQEEVQIPNIIGNIED